MVSDMKGETKSIERFSTNIPPFPKAAQKVISMFRDPRIQIGKVAEVVALDQGFAARVLRMANSAYFGLPRRVHSITEALVLLGWANVRMVLISASVGNILCRGLKAYGLEEGALWEHSVGSAYAAQILSSQHTVATYDMAFTCGLLHDIGKAAIDLTLTKQESQRLHDLLRTKDTIAAEKEVTGFSHSEVGAYLTTRWNLPEEIRTGIEFHHDPTACRQDRRSVMHSIIAGADICVKVLFEEMRDITKSDIEQGTGGTLAPRPDLIKRLNSDLPPLVSASKELMQGITEVVPVGSHQDEK